MSSSSLNLLLRACAFLSCLQCAASFRRKGSTAVSQDDLMAGSFVPTVTQGSPTSGATARLATPSSVPDAGSNVVSAHDEAEWGEDSRRDFISKVGAAAMSGALMGATPAYAAAQPSVSWISPKDGATVPSKFKVEFGVTGYELAPAADGLKEGSGHHHVVIDDPKSFVEAGVAIPFDATHKHYGKAQKGADLELEPGKHKLMLQFANANHESYGKKLAKVITVNVVEPKKA